MQVLDRQTTAGPSANPSTGGMRILLRATGQTIDLPRGKTTIGSSPRCNVRVQEPGVQPLHCLILREGQKLTVRRWAGETLLNGQRLDESPLALGDSLQVGPVELEIVQSSPKTVASTPAVAVPKPPVAAIPSVPKNFASALPNNPAVNSNCGLTVSRDAARGRSRKLLAGLRKDRGLRRELQDQLLALASQLHEAASEREAVADQLRRANAELIATRQRVHEQEAAIVAYQPLACEKEQLTREVAELQWRLEQTTSDMHATEAMRQSLVDREAELSANVEFGDAEIARLTQWAEELSARSESLASELESMQLRFEEQQASLHSLAVLRAELEAQLQTIEGEKAETECERQSLAEKVAAVYTELELAAVENGRLQQANTELSNQVASTGCERDELRRHAEELQSVIHSLDEQNRGAEQERQTLGPQIDAITSERDELQAQVEELRAAVESLTEEKADLDAAYRLLVESEECRSAELRESIADNARLLEEQAELESKVATLNQEHDAISGKCEELQGEQRSLTTECERLRGENARISELERKLRDAVADRESTSTELYNALINLSEMQERYEHSRTVETARQSVRDELDKSAIEIADLTAQVERLVARHAEAEAARAELARQQSATAESQVRLANEKLALEESISDMRDELAAAGERAAESAAKLAEAEAWRHKYEELAENEVALLQVVSALESQVAGHAASGADVAQVAAQYQGTIAGYERQVADSTENVARLEQQLANAGAAMQNLVEARQEWCELRIKLESEQTELRQQISELESQLNEALEAQRLQPVAAAYEAASEVAASNSGWANAEVSRADWSVAQQDTTAPRSSAGWETEGDTNDVGFENPAGWGPESSHDSQVEEESLESSATDLFAAPVEPVKTKAEPTSFIERYSHMFADDKPAADAEPVKPMANSHVEDRRLESRAVSPLNTSKSISNEEEESIEQYMAKLLQRVRGDEQPAAPADKPQPTAEMQAPSGPLGYEPSPLEAEKAMTLSAISLRDSLVAGEVSGNSQERLQRKASMPAPQTDLEALRALANESARRAISRHALRKYRRTAITKLIVSALAGVTSLWLMLQAPTWLDWQFMGGCLSMLVAAYWAGETCRATVQTIRVASKDETEQEIEEISAELKSRLPIDVISEE